LRSGAGGGASIGVPDDVKRSRTSLPLALLLPLALGAVAAAPAEDEPRDLKSWIDGPVRYIARKAEVQAFRDLETDDARALFVERFWARRDPTPNTLTNEYRHLFWTRVQEANSNFVDSPRPGWMTDRGKIHVLYGPPTEIQQDHFLHVGGSPTSGRGVIRWIYEGRPGDRMDLDPVTVVPFERDMGGEYRLSYEPKLAGVFWDPNAIREGTDDPLGKMREILGAPLRSELSVMLDLGRMGEVPPAEQVVLESVETAEAYQTLPVEVSVQRYRPPDRDGTLTVLAIDLDTMSRDTIPAILARFTPAAGLEAEPRILGEDSFRVVESASTGERLAEGRLTLAPGDWALTVFVADPQNVRTGIHRDVIRVPGPSASPHLSDLVWANEIEPLPYRALASHDEPYHVGPFRVVPRLGARWSPGDTVRLFFEVYRAELPIRVRYVVEGRENDGTWVALGSPSILEQDASAVAWEVQTTPAWPAGEYRVSVEVEDAAGRLVSARASFTLVSGDGGTPE